MKFFTIVFAILAACACAQYGQLKDLRDDKSYPTYEMAGLAWFVTNLDYDMPGSYCYNNSEESCEMHGRLYTWDAAQKACPDGWRLPTEKESSRMLYDENVVMVRDFLPHAAGLRSDNGKFMNEEEYGYYWTSTATKNSANYFFWKSSDFSIKFLSGNKNSALSVRCVK